MDSLSFQALVHNFLALANCFRAGRDLLEQDLHHVDLAGGEAVHLCVILGYRRFVLRGLKVSKRSKLRVGNLKKLALIVILVASGLDFLHLARVVAHH